MERSKLVRIVALVLAVIMAGSGLTVGIAALIH